MFKNLKITMLLSFVSLLIAPQIHAETKSIDNFEAHAVSGFPAGWDTYPLKKGKAKQVYKIAEEAGNKYLAAVDESDISVPIFKDLNWDLSQNPTLKFKWRAKKLPAGASETSGATNDSACGVYVGFGGKLSGVALKYVWSSTAPLNNVWEKGAGKFFVIVKKTGSGGVGTWNEVSINVAEDYKKNFKTTELKKPFGLGVLTDGNAVHAAAACDYDDFRFE